MSEICGFKKVRPVVPPRPRHFFEKMYPVPRRFVSDEDDLRWGHLDLEEMSLEQLRLEQDRVRGRLTYDPTPPAWLFDRLRAIEERIANASR